MKIEMKEMGIQTTITDLLWDIKKERERIKDEHECEWEKIQVPFFGGSEGALFVTVQVCICGEARRDLERPKSEHKHVFVKVYDPVYKGTEWEKEWPLLSCTGCAELGQYNKKEDTDYSNVTYAKLPKCECPAHVFLRDETDL